MHILMLSDWETQNGAAIAASHLAWALGRVGHRVTYLVDRPDGREHPWDTHVLTPIVSLRRLAARRLLPAGLRAAWDAGTVRHRLRRLLADLRPDVIDVHNLHGAVGAGWSVDLLRICLDQAPTVWTLHDMWSFTGRCAFSYDCRKFLTGCDAACPTPDEHPALAPTRIAGAWEGRRRLFAGRPQLIAVTPSRWLAREAQAGLWAGHRVGVIPNGLPLDVYRPVDRALARQALGIETLGPVLLVAAQNLAERRKGGSLLVGALQRLSPRPLTLVTLGGGRLDLDLAGMHVHPLGFVDHERTRVLAYSAADVFVHAAPVDNLPNVVMEAVACGTPVAGFGVGGVPDMVRPGQTGWLAREVSPEGLAGAVEAALDDLNRGPDLRDTCRAVAEAEYGADLQARRYVDLYQSLAAIRQDRPSPWKRLTRERMTHDA